MVVVSSGNSNSSHVAMTVSAAPHCSPSLKPCSPSLSVESCVAAHHRHASHENTGNEACEQGEREKETEELIAMNITIPIFSLHVSSRLATLTPPSGYFVDLLSSWQLFSDVFLVRLRC